MQPNRLLFSVFFVSQHSCQIFVLCAHFLSILGRRPFDMEGNCRQKSMYLAFILTSIDCIFTCICLAFILIPLYSLLLIVWKLPPKVYVSCFYSNFLKVYSLCLIVFLHACVLLSFLFLFILYY